MMDETKQLEIQIDAPQNTKIKWNGQFCVNIKLNLNLK